MSDLSILCVTRGEPHALRFVQDMAHLQKLLDAEFVLVLDERPPQVGDLRSWNGWAFHRKVVSGGDIGSVLDDALKSCTRTYVLRLDDDERCSQRMVEWLKNREYDAAPHWKFPRANLWQDERHYLHTAHLWPDHQTRLSWKQFSGNRPGVHDGSPYGGGTLAPVAIEHHKFLVRSLDQRRDMIRHYDAIQPGAGSNFRPFQTPEEFYTPAEMAEALQRWDG